ncbi:unnamed protein product [Mytilus edulis]|uniref:Tyr recombinase domain-containing protein n=1 Tax=Mytilus edulis TaxID=6550 RepID=A0A8S3VDM0_MYTED|nr:unnamed protein product [Mytilus edulis]
MSPQGKPHPLIQTGSLNLVAWKISVDKVLQRNYQKQLSCMKKHGDQEPNLLTIAPGENGSAGPNEALDIKHLSWKLVMLLALYSAGRASEIGMLNCKYMKQQGSQVLFELPKLTKTCRPGSKTKSIALNSFPNEKSLCVVTCINDYLSRTQSWREQGDNIDRSWLLNLIII